MSGKTLYLEGLDELEPDDVLYWLKETLARDLAAMRAPKSAEERAEVLRYAMRRIDEGARRIASAVVNEGPRALTTTSEDFCVIRGSTSVDPDHYYDQDGDPPWKPLPDWAAS